MTARAEEGRRGSWCLMGDSVTGREDKEVLRVAGGDGGPTM